MLAEPLGKIAGPGKPRPIRNVGDAQICFPQHGRGRGGPALRVQAGRGRVPSGKGLKGFAKVFLKAGESKTVTISLDGRAFRYFNVDTNQFEVKGGDWAAPAAKLPGCPAKKNFKDVHHREG